MVAHVTPLEVEVYITDIAVSGQVFNEEEGLYQTMLIDQQVVISSNISQD